MGRQAEKTRQSRERILRAATAEFGAKGYDAASITAICEKNNIPKGLVYHNFKGKDDLYLRCAEICFHAMTAYLADGKEPGRDVQESLRELLLRREQFFHENPCCRQIFFQTLIYPPVHLAEELRALRRELDEFHREYYRGVLRRLHLREGITEETAIRHFLLFQEAFNASFQAQSGGESFPALIEAHEQQLLPALDILLYGVAEQDGTAG